jgi:hypothetical protein
MIIKDKNEAIRTIRGKQSPWSKWEVVENIQASFEDAVTEATKIFRAIYDDCNDGRLYVEVKISKISPETVRDITESENGIDYNTEDFDNTIVTFNHGL